MVKFRKNDFGVENRPLGGLCRTLGDSPGIPKVGYGPYHRHHRPTASTVPAPVMQGQSLHTRAQKDDYNDTQWRQRRTDVGAWPGITGVMPHGSRTIGSGSRLVPDPRVRSSVDHGPLHSPSSLESLSILGRLSRYYIVLVETV